MPSYTYQCTKCNKVEERICSIEEMEAFESGPMLHDKPCGGKMQRIYAPSRPVRFRSGWYEHLGPEPVYIESMQQLHDVAEKNGNYSHYAEDMGGLFGRKRRVWV